MRAQFQKVWDEGVKKYPIDAANLKKLFETVDVIGVSGECRCVVVVVVVAVAMLGPSTRARERERHKELTPKKPNDDP